MKNLLTISLLTSVLLSSCSIDWNDENTHKIMELERRVQELIKDNENWKDKEIIINKPANSIISKKWNYSLDCKTKYFTNTIIEWSLINKSYIKTSEWHEKVVLYVNNNTAKFFGADFSIIQDDEWFLIINRNYQPSWLTETITVNKNSWIWFDIKTLWFWLSWAPVSDTYILSCSES